MKTNIPLKIQFLVFLQFHALLFFSQNAIPSNSTDFFETKELLEVGIKYSLKDLKRSSKDSIWTNVEMKYFELDSTVKTLNINLKTRGNFRLNNCYFSPVKVKIRQDQRNGTIFKDQKKMKLVMPCKKEARAIDFVIKEYLAYKLYELISPVHFKTRLLKIHFIETKNNKDVEHDFYGFFIEDLDNVADRYDGKEIKNYVPQPNHEPGASVRNSMFQFMIGNVDYSAGHQHNGKLIYLESGVTSVLYDFDMSGFVDPSYGQLPMVNGEVIDLASLKERLFRGYLRDESLMQSVREDFISKKEEVYQILEVHRVYFEHEKELEEAIEYIDDFYEIIENDRSFHNNIIRMARKG